MKAIFTFVVISVCLCLSQAKKEKGFLEKVHKTSAPKTNSIVIEPEQAEELVSNLDINEINTLNNVSVASPEDLIYYHSVLNSSFYYGNWMSDERSTLFGFNNQEGFLFTNFRAHRSLDLQISLYDGYYVDQGSISLAFDYTINSAMINPQNGTLSFGHLWIEYKLSGPIKVFNVQNYLATNKPLIANGTIPNRKYIGVQFEVSSDFCPFRMITNVMTSQDELVDAQYIPYSLVTLLFVIVQGIITHMLHDILTSKPSRAKNTSAWSFMFLNAYDFFLIIFNTANFIDPLTIYAIIAIPYLFLSLNMQRVIWGIFDIQTDHLDSQTRDRTICEMYIWIYILLVVPSVLTFIIYPDFIFYFTFLFLVPQIIHNFKQGKKYRTSPWMISALIFPKIAFMAYLKLDSNNLFRYTPNETTFLIFMGLIIVQILTLLIQTEWPRFGFEVKTSYYFFEANLDHSQNICAICLEQFRSITDPINLSEPFLQANIEDSKMIRTPCKHEFHEHCLKRWVESKLECPYCRHALPSFSDSSDDEYDG